MKELIEKLKDKTYVRAFGLMTPEEREAIRNLGAGKCLCFTGLGWKQAFGNGTNEFGSGNTYAINPDYQPPEEFVDVEICIGKTDMLGAWDSAKKKEWLPIHCLPSLQNFVKFVTESEQVILTEHVAVRVRDNEKVYARFLKSE